MDTPDTRTAELEAERDFLRLALQRAMLYVVKQHLRLYDAQGELDAYHRLLDVSTDALAWSLEREQAA